MIILSDDNVKENNCYWISESYYQETCSFYRNNKDPIDLSFKRMGGQTRGTPVIDARQFYSGIRTYR